MHGKTGAAAGRWGGRSSRCGIPWLLSKADSATKPFSAAQAAGLRSREEASFCWLQGREHRQVFFYLPPSRPRARLLGIPALSLLCTTISLEGMSAWSSRVQAWAPALPRAHPTAHATAAHLTASHPNAHLHAQAALSMPQPRRTPLAVPSPRHRCLNVLCMCPCLGRTPHHWCPAHTQPHRHMPRAVPTT